MVEQCCLRVASPAWKLIAHHHWQPPRWTPLQLSPPTFGFLDLFFLLPTSAGRVDPMDPDTPPPPSPDRRQSETQLRFFDDEQRRTSSPSAVELPAASEVAYSDNGSSHHIRMQSPPRPRMPQRHSVKGTSAKNINEALRLARAREEQETLLGEHEEADDDGCYPPRQNSDPRAPNPHLALPVYTTIHKIRHLVIASIGIERS